MSWYRYPETISVAERREKAEKKRKALEKKGEEINPVIITTKKLVNTFWGQAWCTHLESFSDYAYRLERGRSYVRHGCVIDLNISSCTIQARVLGTKLYDVKITINSCIPAKWESLVAECAGKIDSLIELLQGKFSQGVMAIMVDKQSGLLPDRKDINFKCSCPDYAYMCKHIAAVFYGVGARLDTKPEELFLLRHVDHLELLSVSPTNSNQQTQQIEDGDLSALFDIEMDTAPSITAKEKVKKKATAKKKSTKKPSAKRTSIAKEAAL
jgi:uncharacterized Zn finger protein